MKIILFLRTSKNKLVSISEGVYSSRGRSSEFKSRGWPFYVLVNNLSNVSAGSTDPSTVFSTLD